MVVARTEFGALTAQAMFRPGVSGERSCAGSAFTLVEVLTVVAILAVLAMLVVPATSKVRAAGQQSRCVSNLKQLSLAVQQYATERNGLLPAPSFGPPENPGGPMENWLVVLPPYAGVSTWETDNVFVCPAGHKEYKAVTFNPTYGYNGYLRNSSERSESQMRLANIRSPARTCLIMDGKNAWGG